MHNLSESEDKASLAHPKSQNSSNLQPERTPPFADIVIWIVTGVVTIFGFPLLLALTWGLLAGYGDVLQLILERMNELNTLFQQLSETKYEKDIFVKHLMSIGASTLLLCWLFGIVALIANICSTRKKLRFSQNEGITVGRFIAPGYGTLIPWSALRSVEICQDSPFSKSLELRLTTFRQDVCHIRWDQVLACVDPGQLCKAIHEYAPHAKSSFKLPSDSREPVVDSTSSYTKLWFKYSTATTDRRRTSELPGGDVLDDRYTVVRRVGGGGQGTAYLAVGSDGKEILLKEYILPLHRSNQILQETIIKLEHEAKLLRTIEHPQIVALHDCFVEDYRGYLVMEFVEGKTLKELVDTEGPQPEAIVRGLAKQACEIVSYLHAMDPPVIHRDLTPDNFILQENGLLKLVDFNVAHQLESQVTATVVGKHCYIPPEQFRGKPTIQSDIYALGGTLHFLLTGQEPEPITVSHPKSIKDSVGAQMDEVIGKATATDSRKRYASVWELAKDLSALR